MSSSGVPILLTDPCCAMCLKVVVVKQSRGKPSKRKCISASEKQRRLNLAFVFQKYIDVNRGLDETSLHQFDPFPFCRECQTILEQLQEHHYTINQAIKQITCMQAKVFANIVNNPGAEDAAGSDAEDLNYVAGVRAFRSSVNDMFQPKVMVTSVPNSSSSEREVDDTNPCTVDVKKNRVSRENDGGHAGSSSNSSSDDSPKLNHSLGSDSPAETSSDEDMCEISAGGFGGLKKPAVSAQSLEAILFTESELGDVEPEDMEVIEGIVE